MESLYEPMLTEKLNALGDKPHFEFFKGADFSELDHGIKTYEFPFGSAYVETLAAGWGGKLNEDAPLVLPMGEGRVLFAGLDAASSKKPIQAIDSEGISGAFYISHMVSLGFGNSEEYKALCNREE